MILTPGNTALASLVRQVSAAMGRAELPKQIVVIIQNTPGKKIFSAKLVDIVWHVTSHDDLRVAEDFGTVYIHDEASDQEVVTAIHKLIRDDVRNEFRFLHEAGDSSGRWVWVDPAFFKPVGCGDRRIFTVGYTQTIT